MKSDPELAKTFKIDTTAENIIELVFLNEETESENNTRQSELVLQELEKVGKEHPDKRFNLLVDLTPVGNANFVSERSGKLYSHSPFIKNLLKVAVVSKGFLLKMFVFSIALATGKSESVKWFENKEGAVDWLKK